MGRGRQARASRGHGTGARAPPGDQKTPGHSRATRKTSAGSHRHPHTRAVPQRLGRRPLLAIPGAGPTPQPRRQGRRAVHPPSSIHPSILNRSVFHLSLTPRLNILGTHSRARAAQTGGPPHRHRLRLRGKGGHDRLLLTTAAGLGEPGPTRQSHPNPPAFPLGSHHGAGCAHTAHARPPTRRTPGGARRDPPPTQRGEARAAVGNKSSTRPHRGAGAPITPLPHRGEGGFSAHVLWQAPRWPLRTWEGQQLGGPVPQGSLSDR